MDIISLLITSHNPRPHVSPNDLRDEYNYIWSRALEQPSHDDSGEKSERPKAAPPSITTYRRISNYLIANRKYFLKLGKHLRLFCSNNYHKRTRS